MPGKGSGGKAAGGAAKHYSGGIGTAVTSKPGGPMVTLGSKPKSMPHPATPRPPNRRQV